MNTKPYLMISGAIFALVALGHAIRLIGQVPIRVGSMDVPMVVSWGGVLIPVLLTLWAFRLAGRANSAAAR